jgi:hypothetical protein
MTITATAPPIDADTVQRLISPFTLRGIGARDLMVDAAGVLSFFYGPAGQVRRVQIQQTGQGAYYFVEIGRVDTKTRRWIPEQRHHVRAEDLRETIRELT